MPCEGGLPERPASSHAITGVPVSRRDFAQLFKLPISIMSTVSAATGFVAFTHALTWRLLLTSGAILLLAGAACALNEAQEHRLDALMDRTRFRPIPSGKISPLGAVACAAILALIVSGRRGVLLPMLAVVAVVGGVPGALVLGAQNATALAVVDAAVLVLVVLLAVAARVRPESMDRAMNAFAEAIARPETRQVAAGLLFGLACTARLTIVFGFPFLILVGGGGSWARRALLAGAGAMVPLVALLVYTYADTGHLFSPVYDYLYQQEAAGYAFLNYNSNWSIEDLRYVPQNLMIMLFNTPTFNPQTLPNHSDQLCQLGQARGLFDMDCPIAVPNPVGMSVILTSPAYLLAPLAFIPALWRKLDRVTVGAAIAVVAIVFVNLMHFSQGWVQFGYRFSNDFAPFAIVLVALGASRLGRYWWVLVPFVAASIAINLWGTVWGVMLGW